MGEYSWTSNDIVANVSVSHPMFVGIGNLQIEIRPFGFPTSWASQYFQKQLAVERLVHWQGIDIENK